MEGQVSDYAEPLNANELGTSRNYKKTGIVFLYLVSITEKPLVLAALQPLCPYGRKVSTTSAANCFTKEKPDDHLGSMQLTPETWNFRASRRIKYNKVPQRKGEGKQDRIYSPAP